jgi:predicted amidohydrolase
MKLAAVQFKATRGDKPGTLTRLATLAMEAGRDADLVVLPEMAATGYVFPDREAILPVAETAKAETLAALAPAARENGCWIVCGLPENAEGRLFNSALIIDPSGALHARYRKTLLYEADKTWAEPGDSGYLKVDTGRGTFTVGICMDLNDDRFVDWCRTCGSDVVAMPTNWLDEGLVVWHYWAWRMRRVSSVLVAANTYGTEGDITFSGRSAVLTRERVLASAPYEGDCIVRASL